MKGRETPGWWRGTKPFDMPAHPGSVRLRGTLRQCDLPTFAERPQQLVGLGVTQAYAQGLVISLDDLHFVASWSQFEGCTFKQRRSGRVLNAEGAAAQGSLGWARGPSIYRGCRSEGIRFKALGGYSMDAATFEDCVFDRCRFNGHFHSAADLIRCRFLGTIDGCVWRGTPVPDHSDRRNDIRDNDFTDAVITRNVAWRTGFPLADQHWP